MLVNTYFQNCVLIRSIHGRYAQLRYDHIKTCFPWIILCPLQKFSGIKPLTSTWIRQDMDPWHTVALTAFINSSLTGTGWLRSCRWYTDTLTKSLLNILWVLFLKDPNLLRQWSGSEYTITNPLYKAFVTLFWDTCIIIVVSIDFVSCRIAPGILIICDRL